MKVVAINGSPRKDGNTALALAAISDELAPFTDVSRVALAPNVVI